MKRQKIAYLIFMIICASWGAVLNKLVGLEITNPAIWVCGIIPIITYNLGVASV